MTKPKFTVQACAFRGGKAYCWRVATGRGRNYRIVGYFDSEAEAHAAAAALNP